MPFFLTLGAVCENLLPPMMGSIYLQEVRTESTLCIRLINGSLPSGLIFKYAVVAVCRVSLMMMSSSC